VEKWSTNHSRVDILNLRKMIYWSTVKMIIMNWFLEMYKQNQRKLWIKLVLLSKIKLIYFHLNCELTNVNYVLKPTPIEVKFWIHVIVLFRLCSAAVSWRTIVLKFFVKLFDKTWTTCNFYLKVTSRVKSHFHFSVWKTWGHLDCCLILPTNVL